MSKARVSTKSLLCLAVVSFAENVVGGWSVWDLVEYWKFLFHLVGWVLGRRSRVQCGASCNARYVLVHRLLGYCNCINLPLDFDCTVVVVYLLLTPKFLNFLFPTCVRIMYLYSERFVGNFLLSRNSRRRDDREMVLFCLAYSIRYITPIVWASWKVNRRVQHP